MFRNKNASPQTDETMTRELPQGGYVLRYNTPPGMRNPLADRLSAEHGQEVLVGADTWRFMGQGGTHVAKVVHDLSRGTVERSQDFAGIVVRHDQEDDQAVISVTASAASMDQQQLDRLTWYLAAGVNAQLMDVGSPVQVPIPPMPEQ